PRSYLLPSFPTRRSSDLIMLMWIRRSFTIIALCCFQFAGSLAWASSQHTSPQPVILVVGDSLSAEYGLRRGSGWVSVIEQRLNQDRKSTRLNSSHVKISY